MEKSYQKVLGAIEISVGKSQKEFLKHFQQAEITVRISIGFLSLGLLKTLCKTRYSRDREMQYWFCDDLSLKVLKNSRNIGKIKIHRFELSKTEKASFSEVTNFLALIQNNQQIQQQVHREITEVILGQHLWKNLLTFLLRNEENFWL